MQSDMDFEQHYFEGVTSSDKQNRHFEHVLWYVQYGLRKILNPRVLDIGCGYGHLARQGYDLGIEVHGLDFSRYALRNGWPSGLSIRGDAQRLPYEAASFDAVIILEVLEHLPTPEIALKEIYRILRPGGLLILSTPSTPGHPFHNRHDAPLDPTHISEHEPDHWIMLARSLGFVCRPYVLPFIFSEININVTSSLAYMAPIMRSVLGINRLYRRMPISIRYVLGAPLRSGGGLAMAKVWNDFYMVCRKKANGDEERFLQLGR